MAFDNLNGTKVVNVIPSSSAYEVEFGSNTKAGVATLVAGTVVVSTNKVAADSVFVLSRQNPSTEDGGDKTEGHLRVSAQTDGVSFTILSTDNRDDSDIFWWIIQPYTVS